MLGLNKSVNITCQRACCCQIHKTLVIPAGPLPWDDLSSSDDEEYSPRPTRTVHSVPEHNVHRTLIDSGKASAAEAVAAAAEAATDAEEAAAAEGQSAAVTSSAHKGMSPAIQVAFGLKTSQEVLQVALIFTIATVARDCPEHFHTSVKSDMIAVVAPLAKARDAHQTVHMTSCRSSSCLMFRSSTSSAPD